MSRCIFVRSGRVRTDELTVALRCWRVEACWSVRISNLCREVVKVDQLLEVRSTRGVGLDEKDEGAQC